MQAKRYLSSKLSLANARIMQATLETQLKHLLQLATEKSLALAGNHLNSNVLEGEYIRTYRGVSRLNAQGPLRGSSPNIAKVLMEKPATNASKFGRISSAQRLLSHFASDQCQN